MMTFLIILCAILFVASILILLLARLAKKWNDEQIALTKKAFFYILGNDKAAARKKLKEIDDIYLEIATSDVEVAAEIEVVERAHELLTEAIKH